MDTMPEHPMEMKPTYREDGYHKDIRERVERLEKEVFKEKRLPGRPRIYPKKEEQPHD